MARRPRGLRPEDRDLWQRVAQSVTPLHPPRASFLPEVKDPEPAPPVQERPAPLPAFQIGQKAMATRPHQLQPALADRLAEAPIQMDKKAYHRLTRGKLLPEARIDLHGMTLAQAHPALNRFIHETHAAGRRLVLVITGKGKRGDDHAPHRPGILKHQVPQWLAMQPLAPLILQVTEAHIKHGGAGAYYVYLRRAR